MKSLKFMTLLTLGLVVFSCTKNDDAPATPPSSSADITAFSFKELNLSVIVSGTDIHLTVPEGTDVTKLVATFTTTGASVKVKNILQVSGTTANDFTKAVNYVVIAENETTKTYTVTVSIQTPTSKDITAFSFKDFPDAVATFSGTNINITLPEGTPVTNLVAIFSHTGDFVKVGATEQESGTTPNDFTSLVNYVVTDKSGGTQTYTVTVIAPKFSKKDITAFSFKDFPDAVATFSGTDISIALPARTDVTNLVAIFSHTGASIKVSGTEQTSGANGNNFTSPVKYLVTAEDSSSKEYTVTVTVLPVAEITAFSFADPKGIINPMATIDQTARTIDVTVSAGADLTELTATFTASGTVKTANVVQTSGTNVNNFSAAGGVTYNVSSQDGTANQNYVVTVTKTKFATIPDASFLTFLKANLPSTAFGGIGNNQLDITNTAVTGKTTMDCSNRTPKIENLTGIEYFVGLTKLYCYSNSLMSLDISKNTALTDFQCNSNSLSSLDVSNNTALITLNCRNNSLSSLNVSNNTALITLNCSSNSLTSLDVSKNTALTDFQCNSNSLTSLDVSKNTALGIFECYSNQLTILDISFNAPLYFIIFYSGTYNLGPIEILKVNVSTKDKSWVNDVKSARGSNVTISTYTNSSADARPFCADYNPGSPGACAP